MTHTLLYRPNRKWPIYAAFAVAVLLHVAAISLGRTQPPPVVSATGDEGIDIVMAPPEPETAETTLPDPDPPPSISDDNEFPDVVTPPPVHKVSPKKFQPSPRPPIAGQSASMDAAKVFAIRAPRPEYPYEARRQRMMGSGVAVLTIDSVTGTVIGVAMSQSTGSAVLDNATISAFRRWRFRPGTVSRVQTAITFTLTGAAY